MRRPSARLETGFLLDNTIHSTDYTRYSSFDNVEGLTPCTGAALVTKV